MKLRRTLGFLLIVLTTVSSCKKEPVDGTLGTNAEEVGTWKLVEQLMDPGDGSGTFQPDSSNKTVIFSSNGNIYCNGALCTMDEVVVNPPLWTTDPIGTYDMTTQSLYIESCVTIGGMSPSYYLENGHLIIRYPCIEPCLQKFERQ